MKANEPKRKIFADAVDLIGGNEVMANPGITMLDVESIRPFHNHPFRLYEGERLQDMVESIKEHGVLNPVIVRKYNGTYEMLSGHNRHNAAKIAGIVQIPAIVKEHLSEEEAYVYVIETNLMQRSFTDLSVSEKAAVLAERYDKVMSQGKRNDILRELEILQKSADISGGKENKNVDKTCGNDCHKLKSRDGVGEEYGLSGRTVANLLRINNLIPELKLMVDEGILQLMAAVQLSYLPERCQKIAWDASMESGVAINKEIATNVRKAPMTEKGIREAVAGVQPEPHPLGLVEESKTVFKPIKLSAEIRRKYFAETDPREVEDIVDKALAAWFKKKR